MTDHTFSLDEYAQIVVGAAGPSQIEWLSLKLRRGELPGYKAGRKWRATQADIDKAIELLRPKRVAMPEVPSASSMTRTSRRRLSA